MLLPVIMSGGAGTRLWPVSRRTFPKPFMRLPDGQSLLEKTYLRALSVNEDGAVLTVTNRDHYFLSKDVARAHMPDSHAHYLLEPVGRNTAPALLLAALYAVSRFGRDTVLLALPADHLIADLVSFKSAVQRARTLAERKYLVTFGIEPTHPETGYGYIEQGEDIESIGALIDRFVEKPDLAHAQSYLASGRFLWNSGMFCLRADALLEVAQQVAPELLAECEACMAASGPIDPSLNMLALDKASLSAVRDISFDYAIMEHANRRAMVRAGFDWNDIGSWKSISELGARDAAGNSVSGPAVLIDSERCYVQSEGRVVAAVGVSDLVIVDAGDAVLVTHRDKAQSVKAVVEYLRTSAPESIAVHTTVQRPWGSYTVLEDGSDCKVKRLVVKPGQVLSLQLHHRRSEHWTVVRGTAKVTVGDREIMLHTNQSVEIPVNTKHRLENPTDSPIALIEVQCGDYFGEDDIVRFEDRYGRV
ncbi:mannose-1-phosphate guanylyltransferase/mannose-6-phosphate isomerase [bacterium]|nr:mannose-1-phosphate guanylyltransferase/mannose-6-phosphate isomerase [bacterium]